MKDRMKKKGVEWTITKIVALLLLLVLLVWIIFWYKNLGNESLAFVDKLFGLK